MVQDNDGIEKVGQFGQRFMKNRLGHIIIPWQAKEPRLHSVGNGTVAFEKIYSFFLNNN